MSVHNKVVTVMHWPACRRLTALYPNRMTIIPKLVSTSSVSNACSMSNWDTAGLSFIKWLMAGAVIDQTAATAADAGRQAHGVSIHAAT